MITMSGNKISFLQFLLIFPLLISSTIAIISSPVLYEIVPFVRVYTDGRAQRMSGTKVVPPSVDPKTRCLSKDIIIEPKLNISARLFLPKSATSEIKLPLLVYFHGGGFFTGSPFSPTYHNHLTSLVDEANVVAVSVNYRLAPENPLPIAYQDSWLALQWAFSHSKGNNGSEPWLKNHVDFGRVYVGGDSAGGNIAHNMGIRAGLDKTDHGVEIYGMFLNCPHFWGDKLIGNEATRPVRAAWIESIWVHAYPNSTGFDDPLSNPALDPNLSKLGPKTVLIYVAEMDILRNRGLYYEQALRESKWNGSVKAVEVKRQDHVFNIIFPQSPKAKIMLKELSSFLNQGQV